MISIKFDVSAWESLPFNSRLLYLLIVCALASLCLWFCQSICVCVCVCRVSTVLWWTEQRFGNAPSCWYLRGPNVFITHGLPRALLCYAAGQEVNFRVVSHDSFQLLVYRVLGPFSSIHTHTLLPMLVHAGITAMIFRLFCCRGS